MSITQKVNIHVNDDSRFEIPQEKFFTEKQCNLLSKRVFTLEFVKNLSKLGISAILTLIQLLFHCNLIY